MIHAEGCPFVPTSRHEGPCTEQQGFKRRRRPCCGNPFEVPHAPECQDKPPREELVADHPDVRLLPGLRPCCLTDEAAVHQPDCPVTLTQQNAEEPLAPVQGEQPRPVIEWHKMSIQGEEVLADQPRFPRAALMADVAPRLEDVDMVNHPPHYRGPAHRACGEPLECIDVVRDKPFNVGNAIKYLWRAGAKHDHIEDLKKAVWYIQDEIARLEEQE